MDKDSSVQPKTWSPPPLRWDSHGGSDFDGIRTFLLFSAFVAAITSLMVWLTS